ncbi:MAG TPA: hypothetical protein VE965_01460, partial [Gammaproteobacteria bacterium]|nr:hypothetical protein [Gammaproteobacteria bacterium]
AGGVLRPLSALTHREVGTLYHELFHAFFDYLRTNPDRAALEPFASRVLHAAEGERLCRYQTVSIAPVIQRPTDTEPRYLSDRESWEALNETWAVFVGWTIWARLEVASQRKGKAGSDQFIRWIKRLAKADNDGDLVGYYEPEEASERAITRKRYLARTNRISPEEVRLLLETVLELSPDQAKQAEKNMRADSRPCQADGG